MPTSTNQLAAAEMNVIHLLGGTCVGKSTLLNLLEPRSSVYTIQIGKLMRAKYGPDYFKGQAAPAHTQAEAWQMYCQGLEAAQAQNRSIVVVDGQPRAPGTVDKALKEIRNRGGKALFVMMHATHAVRETRVRIDRKPGPELELALARLTNDYTTYYGMLVELAQADIVPLVLDTTDLRPEGVLRELDQMVSWPLDLQ